MAQRQAAALKTLVVKGCSQILGKARDVISKPILSNEGSLGNDALDTWRSMFAGNSAFQQLLPSSFTFHIDYEDAIDSSKPSDRIVLTTHGSPGSHEDFKYMTPKLIESGSGFRMLNLNWPEHGYSLVSDEHEYYYCHSSDERSELLGAFLDGLKILKVDVMVGHSFGCYPLIAFGADEVYRRYCNALLLINCGGPTPHKSIRPYHFFQMLAHFSYNAAVGSAVRAFFYAGSRLVLGPKVKSVESAANNLMVIAHLGYRQLPHRLEILRTNPQTPRVLFVYAEDDKLIEPKSSESLVRALGCPTPALGYKDDSLKTVEDWWRNWDAKNPGRGTKNLAINFGKGRGNHFLQKHQADFLASCISVMSQK